MSGPLVVWINGAFGVGKTCVAEKLVARLPGSLLFDPELLGALLRVVVPQEEQTDDFQDLATWRHLSREAVVSLALSRRAPVIVAMTIARDDYFSEVVEGIRDAEVDLVHVTLVAPGDVIAARLRARSANEDWGLARVERCVEALASPRYAVHLDAQRAPALLADEIAGLVWSFAVERA